jgi:two-component system chemotaxis response regulator CheY
MLRALLVDDDQDILTFAKALLLSPRPSLSGVSIDVMTVDNPVSALDRAREQEFDLIITDANMKPHSGFELVRLLRQLPTTAATPIAMLTGRREKRDVERAVQLGVQAYLVKPLDPAAFVEKVDELLDKRQQAKRTVRFAVVQLDEPAQGECYFRLKALTDNGGVLEADIRPRKGLKVQLKSPVLEQLGFMHLPIEVIDSQDKDGGWEVRFVFQALEDRQLQRLRAYIAAKTSSSPAASGRKAA